MKAIAICCTPYQILNLINLSINQFHNYEIDLVLVDHFEGYDKLYNKFIDKKIFNKVYLCKHKYIKENGLKEHKNLYFNIIENYIENFKMDKYDKFILGNNLIISNILFAKLKKLNKNLDVVLIEDGLLTYTSEFEELKTYVKFIRRMMGQPIIEKKYIKSIYVYDRDLICYKINSNTQLINLEKINNRVANVIKDIFMDDITDSNIYKNIIYLDQPFTSENLNISEKEVLKNIKKYLGNEITVKLHPRQNKEIYNCFDLNILEKSKCIWEIELLSINNLEEKTIVTVNSSAAFTPILLYGVETNIILLNNIFNKYNQNNLVYKFINKFIEKYKTNIFLPDSYEELSNYPVNNKGKYKGVKRDGR